MRELNTANAGIDAAATSRPGYAERGPWQLRASDTDLQHGKPVRISKRS